MVCRLSGELGMPWVSCQTGLLEDGEYLGLGAVTESVDAVLLCIICYPVHDARLRSGRDSPGLSKAKKGKMVITSFSDFRSHVLLWRRIERM